MQKRAKGTNDEKIIATIHMKGIGTMGYRQRRKIAAWLRDNAAHVLKHGREYSTRVRSRYYAA